MQIMSDFVESTQSLRDDFLLVATKLDEHCKNVSIARVFGSSVAAAGSSQFPSSITAPPHSSLRHATERETDRQTDRGRERDRERGTETER